MNEPASYHTGPHAWLEEQSIAGLQAGLVSGEYTSQDLTRMYLERIEALDRAGPRLSSVIETNPDAIDIAAQLDRGNGNADPNSALRGLPILIKDNIGTGDAMETTAGSLALVGAKPARDAFVAARLRAAGAVLLGKANMSEWANFRSLRSSSGWSARGGQCLNPYALDRTPSGSSSGSGAAVAANLAVAALGSETDGSILSPSAANGIVGLKPTVGLTSRAGVIPIAHSQDTIGPMTRTVADAALILSVIAGHDPADPGSAHLPEGTARSYLDALDPDGLRGARIGIPRDVYWGYSTHADRIAEEAIAVMRDLGAEIIDPAPIPTAQQLASGWPPADDAPLTVLLYEFKSDFNAYLASVNSPLGITSLADLIAFNQQHADQEMPFFGQELFEMAAAKGPLTDPDYLAALERNGRLSRTEGIDAALSAHHLDALMMPTGSPPAKIDLVNGDRKGGGSSRPAALAGYPAITVPAGFVLGLPVGITFMTRAFGEATLLRLAYAFEQATKVRRAAAYLRPGVMPLEVL